MSWSHLVEIVPQEATALGVRIIENVPVKLVFVGCTYTQGCIENFGVVTPMDGHRVTREFSCNDCGREYRTSRTVSDSLFHQNYFDLDGQHWFSTWIGVARDQVAVHKIEK